MRICIIQSNYIPWKGFFDLIGRCDEYVIFDGVQYARRHWHNRNRIKTANGVMWLTIPVATRGRFEQPIDEVEIEKSGCGKSWAEKHWRALELAYRRAPFFDQLEPGLTQHLTDGRFREIEEVHVHEPGPVLSGQAREPVVDHQRGKEQRAAVGQELVDLA